MRSLLQVSAFPERLKKRRIELNMTQQELAEKTQISLKTISTWEKALDSPGSGIKHGPKALHIIDLCNALNCDFEYLFGSEEHSEPTEVHVLIKKETGLSTSAIDTLMALVDDSNSNIPHYKMMGKSYIDFYSAFICDTEKQAILHYYMEKIEMIKRRGLSSEEIDVFDSAPNAVEFYKFKINRLLFEYLSSYFDDMDR